MKNYADVVIQKYGGATLATPVAIRQVAKKIVSEYKKHRIIVVVSAMGKMTNELINLAQEVTSFPNNREMDMLLTVGERITMSLLSMAINELDEKAISFTGSQCGIVTNSKHSFAKISEIRPFRIKKALEEGSIPVVAGFQGVSVEGNVTTLGRGGSDITAVALASAIGAKKCQFFKSYGGIFTADPNIFSKAKLIPRLTYDEMIVFSCLGAKVLHERSVSLAKKYNIFLEMKNLLGDNTTIIGEYYMENSSIKGIATTYNLCALKTKREDYPKFLKYLINLSNKIDKLHYWVEMEGETSYILMNQDYLKYFDNKISSYEIIKDLVSISMVGENINQDMKLVIDIEKTLFENNLKYLLFTVNPLSLNYIIEKNSLNKALSVLHAFVDK